MKRLLFSIGLMIAISLTITMQGQTCKTPENLSISSLSTSSATLIWDLSTDGDVPSSYFFRLSDSGTVLYTDSNLVTATQSYTMTGLTANTTYNVELGSNCNATQSGISETTTFSFTTPCGTQAAPYTENFDAAIPPCTHSSNAVWFNGGRSGKCMTLSTTAATSAYFVFPELNIQSDNIEVGIWLKANSVYNGNVPFLIGIITDPADIEGAFEPLYSGQLTTTTWTEVRMNTSATQQMPVTQSAMIAVVFPQGLDRTIYIDDASIHVIPTCIRPEDFTISNITATSATFSWTTTNASSVKLYLSSDVDTRTITATTNPYTINTLVPNTDYSFRVRAICSATDSSEINPITLTAHTECVTADSALFLQGFEALTTPNALPDCWHEGWWAKPAGNTKAFPFATVNDRAHTGSRSMTLVQQTDGSVAYLSSQALPFDQSGKYTLSVWIYRQEASTAQTEGLKFWVSPYSDDTTGATFLGYIPRHYLAAPVEHTPNEWYNYEFIINTTGDKYVIVEGISQNGAPVYFDDLRVRLTPSCFRISNVQFGTPNHNSIGMTWTPGRNEQQWIISYSLNDGAFVTDTVSSPAFTIQNLTPATTYDIEGTITSLCGPGDMSDPVSFNSYFVTTCEPLSVLPYSCGFETEELSTAANPMPLCWSRWSDAPGSNNIYPQASNSTDYSYSGSGFLRFMPATSSTSADYGEHQVAVLPLLNTTVYPINTLRLIMYGQATTINPAPMITVGVMTDPTDFSTFTATDSFFVGTTEYLRYEARFTNYTGNGKYIAFYTKRVQAPFLSLNVDDIRLEPIPSCPDLDGTGVVVSDITDHNVLITVSDLTATTWSYAYGVAGTPLTACTVVDTVSVTSFFLNNLAPNTSYVIYARRRCGTQFGSWSGSVTFRTACGAFQVPYSDDFETQPAGELMGCYYVVADNQHLAVFSENSNTYNHTPGGTKGLSSSHDAQNPAQSTLVENMTMAVPVQLVAGHNYEISIYAKTRTYSSNYRLSFISGTSTSNLNVISTSSVNSSSWNRFSGYITPMTSGNYYLGVMTSAINDDAQYAPYLDDITIREISCVPPTASTVSQLGSTSATIDFTSTGTMWDVAVSSSSTGLGNVYRDTITSTTFTLSNLAINTTYYYTIRTICGVNDASEWMATQSFHTRCTTVNVPYSEGFETVSAVTCWSPLNGEGNISRETSAHNTGTSSMRIVAASAVSPEFNVTTFEPYMLTGWVYSTADSAHLSIGVMTDPDDASSFERLTDVTIYRANEWTEFTTYFDVLSDPDYADYHDAHYLVIAAGNGTIFVDDLNMIAAPTCNRPTQGVISSVSDNSVTADWTEEGGAAQWLLYATTQDGVTTSQVVTSHPYTLTGLATSTNYSLFVRSICTVGDTSIAYKIGDFYTECGYIIAPYTEDFESFPTDIIPTCWDNSLSDQTITYTNHPHYLWGVYSSRGNKSIRMYDAMSSTGDAIIVTPEIVLPAGSNYDFRYDYCHQSSTADLVVGIRRKGQFSFTTIAVHQNNGMTDAATPSAFITGSYGLQAYVGDTVQFMFYGQTHYGSGSTWIDNVKVRQLSDCSEVSAVSVQNATATELEIAFADTAMAHNAWQYAVVLRGRNVSSATPVDITAKTFTVTGLNPATTYDIYVRAVCPGNDYSTWVGVTQKTPALPAVLPYVTDFSNASQNEEWQLLGNGANYFTFGTNSNATFGNGTHAMYVTDGTTYSYNFGSSSITGIARLFDFDESTYTIEFDWKCSGGQYSFDYTRFFLAPSYADLLPTYTTSQVYRYYSWPDNLIPLDGDTCRSMVEGGTQHVSEIIDMTGRAGEYYLVYIWVNDGNGGNDYPLSVGNLSVAELTCEPIVNLNIDENSVSKNTVTATFNNPNVGSDVRWAVSTSSLITDSVASGLVQGTTVTVNGLQPSTRYHLFVRAECSSINCSPWVSVPFQTECAAATSFPLTESFEDLTFPPVCWTMTTLTSVTESHGVVDGKWIQESRNTHSGTKSAGFEGTQRTSALLSTPAISLDPTREYHVSFWLMQSGSSWNDDEVNVYVGPNPDSKSGATRLAHYVIYNSSRTGNGLVFFDLDLPMGLSGDYYVMFEAIDVSNGFIYLDDVTVDIYPPCRNLTTLPTVIATTSTSASVTMDIGARTSVKYGIAPYSASVQPSQIFATETTTDGDATFTGLVPGTSYSLFARGYCADGDSTSWTNPVTITTKADDCFAPENVRLDGQSSDVAATIIWNSVPNASSYQCILIHDTISDTAIVSQAQVTFTSLTPMTGYTLMVRGLCGTIDTTDWSTFTFRTLSTPATLPYVTGFEPTDDNSLWQVYPSGYASNFVVGRDAEAHSSGSRGLYISTDGRSYGQVAPTNPTPQYGVNLYGVTYYTRTIYFPAAGNYEVSFDWKSDPVAGLSYEAYGRAFLAPATATLPVDNNLYMRNLPEGSYAIGANLDNSRTWQRTSSIVTIDQPQYLNLVFMWFAQNTNGYCSPDHVSDMPLAIDNVSVNEVSCLPVTSIVALSVYDTVATVLVSHPEPVDVEYALMTTYSLDSLYVTTLSTSSLRDTIVLNGLQPSTDYYFVARQRCNATDSSSWRVLNFRTTATPAALPYICDFEDDNENANWNYTQEGQTNQFIIGTGTSFGGTHSLYISNDGSTYHFDTTALSFGYAHRIISLPAGLYQYSYDWMCNGEYRDDGARVFLIPADALLFAGSWLYGLSWAAVPKNAIALDGGFMYGTTAYNNHSGSFTITEEKLYNIVIAWRSGTNGGYNPPLSIDNINISPVTCLPPVISLIDETLGENSASFAVTNVNEGSSLVYALSMTDDVEDAFLYDTLEYHAQDTIALTGLNASSTYYINVRSLCSDDDISYWMPLRFKTLCGVVTQFPYTEGFENLNTSNGYVRNAASAFCWSSINATTAKPYYNVTLAQHSEGSNSLRLVPSSTSALYMLLPEMTDLNNLYVTFKSMYDNTSSSAGTIALGYLTDPEDGSTFVSMLNTTRTTTWSQQSAIFTDIPAGARMAFRYDGATTSSYSAFIDDVRVSQLVAGPVYYDTICNNANYMSHGFSVANANTVLGENIFNRIAQGPSDTLIVAHVYRLDNIAVVTKDTICAGEPYVEGMWNLPRPSTRIYRSTFRGASACGCDSTVELNLVVIPVTNAIIDTICHNGSYVFRDTTITDPGKYTRSYLNSYGCTCTDTLYLMELPDTIFDVATVCQNNLPYRWQGQDVTTAGRHIKQIVGPRSCNQVAVLDLTVLSTDSTLTFTICQGGSALVVDTIIHDAGSYIINRLDHVGGCMITYHVTVTTVPVVPVDVYDYVCEGSTYTGNGINNLPVSADTMVTVTTRTIDAQCDSITNVHIHYIPTVYKDVYDTIANGEIYEFDNTDITEGGTYTATFYTAEYNCDSIVTLHLTVEGTAVDNVFDIAIDIVPNPISAGATAYIYGDFSDVVKGEIINNMGQVIQTFVPTTYPIEISDMTASGLYNIRLTTSDGHVFIQKLIVK